jgi:putative transposase
MSRPRRQLGFSFRTWGGRRKGAGRRPKGTRAGVSHRSRPRFERLSPVHVTMRMSDWVWNLRSRRSARVLEKAVGGGGDRFGARVVQASIQGNHIHLLVEANHTAALARGMQGLSVRIAKGMNGLMGRKGRVFADRYHAHVLRTPTEVRNAIRYIRENRQRHAAAHGEQLPAGWVDPFASARPDAARTWLVRQGMSGAGP